MEQVEEQVLAAQRCGELPSGEDARVIAFEIDAMLLTGNTHFVLYDDPAVLDLPRRAIRSRLAGGPAATPSDVTAS
jgi:Tetracyclin repressor-like, C-terminal domain